MNVLEGARRIKYIGRVGLAIAAAAFVFGLITAAISSFTGIMPLVYLPILVLGCLYPAIFGAIFLVVGWIVEGFATPPKTESSAD